MPQFHLYLPQMRMSLPTMAERAGAAERAGFDGIALMDHLAPPLAEQHPMHDAMVAAAWLAAHTDKITISHLVLCDAFRHPAVLAKQAVSLDHASQARFELGIGWGSVPAEFDRFGIGSTENPARLGRLRETMEVLEALWSGDVVDYNGTFHQLRQAQQQPTPSRRLPIVIGGAGRRTMELVADHADWWNCPAYAFDHFDRLKERAGRARPSLQLMVALVPGEAQRAEIQAITARRFGAGRSDIVLGTADELARAFRDLQERGVDRFYVWFTDFAPDTTLARFGHEVLPAVH